MIIILTGVSGAGKTTVGRALARRLKWKFVDADDWHTPGNVRKMRSGTPLTDADRGPWLTRLNHEIRRVARVDGNAVLACSALKRSYRQRLLNGLSAESLRWVYLQGNYRAIYDRISSRGGHFMPASLLASQFAALEVPDPGEAITLDAAKPVAELVSEIIGWLGLS